MSKHLTKSKGTDGKSSWSWTDKTRFDEVNIDEPIVPEDDYLQAMFEGGSRVKILIASANIGNAPVTELDSWVPRHAPHTDVVVFGMQESTYGAAPPVASGEDLNSEQQAALQSAVAKEELKEAKEAVSRKTKAEAAKTAAAAAATAKEDEDDDDDDDDSDDDDAKSNPGGSMDSSSSSQKDQGPKVPGSQHLLTAIAQHLGPDFELLASVMRGQMRIRAYVRKALRKECTHLETGAENTGLGGVVANKGGQVLKFELRGTTLVFVNAHLAAHENAKHCAARDDSVAEVLQGVRLGADRTQDLTQFDHVFWFGDLNYRVEPPAEVGAGMEKKEAKAAQRAHVMELVEKNDFEGLLKMDELTREVKTGRAFANFTTPAPRFKPTFKVGRSIETTYNAKRLPSYCDRVLLNSRPSVKELLECHAFGGCHKFSTSDHKPILARFSVTPTPPLPSPLCASPPFTAPDGSYAYYPQLKFFELAGHDLIAMDDGLTMQNIEADGGSESTTPNPVDGSPGKDRSRQDSMRLSAGGWTLGIAKSDPYVVVSTFPPQLKAAAVAVRTETIGQTLNPRWESTPVLSLRAGDLPTLVSAGCVRLSVFDYDATSSDDLIGYVEFSMAELVASAAKATHGIVAFKRDVVGFGHVRGALSGKIEVNLPGPDGQFPHAKRCVDDSATLKAKPPAACCSIS